MRLMKIINGGGRTVPYDLVKAHEQQIRFNHGQTIDQIMDRGGLDFIELYCVLNDIPYNKNIPFSRAEDFVINEIVKFNVRVNNINEKVSDRFGLRPCEVRLTNDKKGLSADAYFHRWCERTRIVEPSPMIGGGPGGIIHYVTGLIEYLDGTIDECDPRNIRFTDRS
jgi:hypothetical protein